MFHLFTWTIATFEETTYLENEQWGIEVVYEGKQQSGKFFLIPQIDIRSGSIKYYAFDTSLQKALFHNFTKIQGIWGRTAYMLAMRDHAELDAAIERFDLSYFSAIPWVGPKTAKRLLVELKTTLKQSDTKKLSQDDSLIRDMVSSLKALGYDPKKVKELLSEYPAVIEKEQLPVIMQRVIERL